jgi:hypothetical protein
MGEEVAPTLWGPLETAILNHWVPPLPPVLPEDGSRASFRNVVF